MGPIQKNLQERTGPEVRRDVTELNLYEYITMPLKTNSSSISLMRCVGRQEDRSMSLPQHSKPGNSEGSESGEEIGEWECETRKRKPLKKGYIT